MLGEEEEIQHTVGSAAQGQHNERARPPPHPAHTLQDDADGAPLGVAQLAPRQQVLKVAPLGAFSMLCCGVCVWGGGNREVG